MTIEELVDALRTNRIRHADVGGDESLFVDPLIFVSAVAFSGAKAEECDSAAAEAGGICPADLKHFWQLARTAKLFEDLTSGQWGLHILPPGSAVGATREYESDRAKDAAHGDLIIGRFIGDAELLLIRTDFEAKDFGTVIVVGPIDQRSDWDVVAKSFGEFLTRYARTRGNMYWAHGEEQSAE